jgi:hypothetical protein
MPSFKDYDLDEEELTQKTDENMDFYEIFDEDFKEIDFQFEKQFEELVPILTNRPIDDYFNDLHVEALALLYR